MSLFFVDVEAPFGVGSPAVGDMTEFGAVCYDTLETFYGQGHSKELFEDFARWITEHNVGRPVFVSDNPAYDWQWINYYFWQHLGHNPFGHSARRIGDFYAGLVGNPRAANKWKHLRVTKHDHNPVNDAMGNAEAWRRMCAGER